MHEFDDEYGTAYGPEVVDEARLLSDADIQALADELELRLVNRFYKNLGRGVWQLAWRAVVFLLVGLASYGALRGFKS